MHIAREDNPEVVAWSYRMMIGFLQMDHAQIESIFDEIYHDAEDTATLTMGMIKYLATTSAHLFVMRHGEPDAAVIELQRILREIALE